MLSRCHFFQLAHIVSLASRYAKEPRQLPEPGSLFLFSWPTTLPNLQLILEPLELLPSLPSARPALMPNRAPQARFPSGREERLGRRSLVCQVSTCFTKRLEKSCYVQRGLGMFGKEIKFVPQKKNRRVPGKKHFTITAVCCTAWKP